MKNIFFIVAMLFILTTECISQIGINTTNPKALLHIDGASSVATTNPETGNVTSVHAIDDVVITDLGNVGIGTISPSVKLDINSTSVGAIKITDTTEGINKMLVSDANGVGSWASVAGSWYAVLQGRWPIVYETQYVKRQIKLFSEQIHSNIAQGQVDRLNGTIKVPFAGKYRITIGGHWGTNRVGQNPYLIMPEIFVNGISVWTGNVVGYSNGWGLSPTFIAIINLKADDVLTIYNNETTATTSNLVDECVLIVEFLQ